MNQTKFVLLCLILAPAVYAQSCGELPADNVSVGAKPIATIKAAGTRNFTCVDGIPQDPSTCLAKFTGGSADAALKWTGDVFYQLDDGKAVFVIQETDAKTKKTAVREILLDNIDNPPVTEASPLGPNIVPWARWTVYSDEGGAGAPSTLATRIDTTGGKKPATCEGEWAAIPYTCTYEFYTCEVEAEAEAGGEEAEVDGEETESPTPAPSGASKTAMVSAALVGAAFAFAM